MIEADCIIGGIVKHNNSGVGFKVTFSDVSLARKYKDMLWYIIRSDDVQTMKHMGYYDNKGD